MDALLSAAGHAAPARPAGSRRGAPRDLGNLERHAGEMERAAKDAWVRGFGAPA